MNKSGQAILFGVMLFAMAFIAALMMIKPLGDIGDNVRDSIGCELTNQSQGTYISCIAIDIFPALFIIAILAAATGLVTKSQGG